MSAVTAVPTAEQSVLVRVAGWALSRHGLVHAYGHCSLRLDDEHILVSPAMPLGLVKETDACIVVPLGGQLPDGVLGEVRIHREIYRRRPDVGGIVRAMPPDAMTLGTLCRTPLPRHGMGAYFAPRPPLWDDPQLLRSDAQAAALADQLGKARAILMRGNGTVTTGATLQEAAVLTYFLEDACRIELACQTRGLAAEGAVMSDEESAARATWSGRILERMWDYLTWPGASSCPDRD